MGAFSFPELCKSTCICLTEGAKGHDIAKDQNFSQSVLIWTHVSVSECAMVRAVLLPVLYHFIKKLTYHEVSHHS